MFAKAPDNKIKTVIQALIMQVQKLPTELYKSLTWDRGAELSNHKEVYFSDRHTSLLL